MLKLLYQSTMATLVLAILLSGAYPLLVTGVGRLLFPEQASGSLIRVNGKIVGSRLIGQVFTRPEYFHGRPSAAGNGYDATNSSGSNLGPTNQKFYDGLKSNIDAFLKENPSVKAGEVPVDAVTASGSGLDPQISPEAAFAQVARVAAARTVQEELLRSVVRAHIEGPKWGIFGEPVVNVLVLNMDIDKAMPLAK